MCDVESSYEANRNKRLEELRERGDYYYNLYRQHSIRVLELETKLQRAINLLRDVKGVLRTDQHDGHRRIAERISEELK